MNKSFKFSFGSTLSFASLVVIGFCLSSPVLKGMEVEGDANPSKKRSGSEQEKQISFKKVKQVEPFLSSHTEDDSSWLSDKTPSFEENWPPYPLEGQQVPYMYDNYFQNIPSHESEEPFNGNIGMNDFGQESLTNNNNFQEYSNVTNNFYQYQNDNNGSSYMSIHTGQFENNIDANYYGETTFVDSCLDQNSNNNSFQGHSNITNNFCDPQQKRVGNSVMPINVQSFENTVPQEKAAQINKMRKTNNESLIYYSAYDLEIQSRNKNLKIKDAKIELVEMGQLSTSQSQQDWFILTFNTELGQRIFKLSEADLMKYVVSQADKKLIVAGNEVIKALQMGKKKGEFTLKLFKLILGSENLALTQEVHKQLEGLLNPVTTAKNKTKILNDFLGYNRAKQTERWVNLLNAASDFTVLSEELNIGKLKISNAAIGVIPKTAHIPEFPHKAADVGYYVSFDSLLAARAFRVRECELIYCVPKERDRQFIKDAGDVISNLEEGQGYARRGHLKHRLFEIVFKEGTLTQKVRDQLQFLWKVSGSKAQALALVDDYIKNPTGFQPPVVTNSPNQNGYFIEHNGPSNSGSSAQAYYLHQMATFQQQQATIPQQQQEAYPTSNLLNTRAATMTQGLDHTVHMQNGYFIEHNGPSNPVSSVQAHYPRQMATYQPQQVIYPTSNLLNTRAATMTQGMDHKVHMQYTVSSPFTDYQWYLMKDLNQLAGQPVESILKVCAPVKSVVCLNDEQFEELKYQGSPLKFNNEKWYIVEKLVSTVWPVDIKFLKVFVPISTVAWLNTSQLEWVKQIQSNMDFSQT